MKKQLNVETIANELEESAFFRRPERVQPEVDKSTPLPEKPIIQEKQTLVPTTDRTTARPDDRPTGSKRILVRRGFEWYEDQLAALKNLSLREQMAGKSGNMSAMVREALDEFLKKRSAK